MRTWLLILACSTGCSFTHGAAGHDDRGPSPDAADPGPGSGVAPHQPCVLSDSALELCLDFNGADTLGFDSAPAHHDATVTAVAPMVRATLSAPDPAAAFTMASTGYIAEDPALDLPASGDFSIELWVQPAQTPSTTFRAIAHPQYAVTLTADGRARCTIGSNYAQTPPGTIPAGATWTHLGCTFDGSVMAIFVDGDVAGCYRPSSWTAGAPGTTGISLGEPFVGGLDNIHVLARTIGASEMCGLAGRTDCDDSCPGGGGITIQL